MINHKGDFIRTVQYGNRWFKEGIYSPITQNELTFICAERVPDREQKWLLEFPDEKKQ